MHYSVKYTFFIGCYMASGPLFSATNAVLSATPGLTALQAQTAAAIQAVCSELSKKGQTVTSNVQSAESDLYQQCSAMVQNGNAIQNPSLSKSNSNSLGLDSVGLGSALQNVATEEMASTSRIATSTLSGQIASLNNHMAFLHNKLGGGAGDEQNFSLEGVNLFINGSGGFGDAKATSLENGMKFNNQSVLVGGDYRINDHLVAGLATGYSHVYSNFISGANVAGGGIQADVFNVSAFSTYDINDFFVDGIFSYGRSSYQSQRDIVVINQSGSSTGGANRVATATPGGNQYTAGLGVGYNYHYGALNVSPFLRGRYMYGQIDKYSEQGGFGLNLDVNEQRFDSVQTILGTQISYAISQSFGVIIPQATFSWNHEYENNIRNISAHYSADPGQLSLIATTASPTRDYFILGGGVSSVLKGGLQLFLNYQSLLGYQNITSHGFNSGIRYEF